MGILVLVFSFLYCGILGFREWGEVFSLGFCEDKLEWKGKVRRREGSLLGGRISFWFVG